jgi:glycosyltransferase involved in cell wall biosynthesis
LLVLARARPSVALIVLPWPTSGLGLITAAAVSRTPASVVFQLAPWEMAVGRRRSLYRWARRRRQQWIAVSGQNRAAIAATFALPESSVRTIYNGVTTAGAPRDSDVVAARTAVRDELDLPAQARVVLTVGRLHEQKGHADILATLPSTLEDRADVFFVWVGDGELRPELEAEVRRRGLERHVHMLGRREDVETLLLGSDLFLLPSRFEGHPFALLEAMALGIPCVGSDAGGAPEIMRDRVDGLIHARGQADDLARQLVWALDHPGEMKAMAASARTRVADFSESRMIDETLSLLDALATG